LAVDVEEVERLLIGLVVDLIPSGKGSGRDPGSVACAGGCVEVPGEEVTMMMRRGGERGR
jgi:hypothetical protein